MFTRRSFHECANELQQGSSEFRSTYLNTTLPPNERQDILMKTSKAGIEILNILALSVRRDIDYGETAHDKLISVGGIKTNIKLHDAEVFKNNYKGPYTKNTLLEILNLRDALNKIAHFDASRSSFFVDNMNHELLLIGDLNNKYWIAVINIDEFCDAIRNIPDKIIDKEIN